MKRCTRCEQELPLTDFYLINGKKRGQFRHAQCKECVKAVKRSRTTYESNRDSMLRFRYGISSADYEEMYDQCAGQCKICQRTFPRLVVDHCHESGKLRGLLCNACNSGLGLFSDDISILERAIRYLK